MELTSITAMEVVCFALIFHNRHWEWFMTKNLDSCVLGYKCGACPKLAWTRDHPKAVVDVSSLSKNLYWWAFQGRVTYIARFCYSCPGRPSWTSLELVHFLTPSYIYNVFGLNWLLSSISRILKLYRKNNNKKNNVVLYMYWFVYIT